MKTLKETRGFTLIELLAVIVILAIVSVIATTTFLPSLNDSRKNTFAIEANAFKEAAIDAISYYQLNLLTVADLKIADKGTEWNISDDETTYCFTIKKLVELGRLKLDTAKVSGTDPDYSGVVIATSSSTSKGFSYETHMKTKNLYVIKPAGDIAGTDVEDITKLNAADFKLSCAL